MVVRVPTGRPLASVPVAVHTAATSTVVDPAAISAYSLVAKYTDPLEETLVPCGMAVAVSLAAERVKRRVPVAAAAGFLVTPFSNPRLSKKSE